VGSSICSIDECVLLQHIELLRRFYGQVLLPEASPMNSPPLPRRPSCESKSDASAPIVAVK
jgi:hypothetical protein